MKTLIGQVITERTPSATAIPELYLRFAENLQPNDHILTFNYDILLERALDHVGKRYRLFPKRLKNIGVGSAETDLSYKEIIISKLHGSVDWFHKEEYREIEEERARRGHPGKPHNPIFNNPEILLSSILQGPRFPSDPLLDMYRVWNIECFYEKPPFFEASPWLLNPSSMKVLYSSTVKQLWSGLAFDGVANMAMAIVGYSLPPNDEYARQVLYGLVKNYQSLYWDEGIFGRKKAPIVLVDKPRTSEAAEKLLSRYSFIDWNKAECHFEGFDEAALEKLFR